MKKLCFLLLMSWVVMDVTAQNVVYSNLKGTSGICTWNHPDQH